MATDPVENGLEGARRRWANEAVRRQERLGPRGRDVVARLDELDPVARNIVLVILRARVKAERSAQRAKAKGE